MSKLRVKETPFDNLNAAQLNLELLCKVCNLRPPAAIEFRSCGSKPSPDTLSNRTASVRAEPRAELKYSDFVRALLEWPKCVGEREPFGFAQSICTAVGCSAVQVTLFLCLSLPRCRHGSCIVAQVFALNDAKTSRKLGVVDKFLSNQGPLGPGKELGKMRTVTKPTQDQGSRPLGRSSFSIDAHKRKQNKDAQYGYPCHCITPRTSKHLLQHLGK